MLLPEKLDLTESTYKFWFKDDKQKTSGGNQKNLGTSLINFASPVSFLKNYLKKIPVPPASESVVLMEAIPVNPGQQIAFPSFPENHWSE